MILDPNTLTLYLIAAGMNFCLSLVLVAFAHVHSGTLLTRSAAVAIMVLAGGFFAAAYGPMLPLWSTVVGTNVLLLSAGVILYTGFSAYCAQRKPVRDRLGWAMVALTLLPFWYWGLVEPNGIYRSVVFSFAAAAINVRIARLLLQRPPRHAGGWPVLALGLLFGVLVLWMSGRGIMLLLSPPLPPGQKGANPTSWVVVFWYIVLISLMTATIVWMEVRRFMMGRRSSDRLELDIVEAVNPVRGNMLLLWSLVSILSLAIISEVGVAYRGLYEAERARLERDASVANDAFVQHTLQLVSQVDGLMLAVRGYYLRTGSVQETERFVDSLKSSKKFVDYIYLIGPDGLILTPLTQPNKGRSAAERDYFKFHQQHAEDSIFFSPVQTGLITGKNQFRITRRISQANGGFGGVLVAPIDPSVFGRYFRQILPGRDATMTLVGTMDHKIRAREPLPTNPGSWDVPLATPLWEALAKAPQGSYRNRSFIDGVERQYLYKQVGDLPLVMVTGFSDADVASGTAERIRPLAYGAAFMLLAILGLAAILTIIIRQRDTQSYLLARLKESNDQTQALFNATNEGVILLDGDTPLDCNPGALRIFRANSREQLLALHPASPELTPPTQPDGTDTRVFAERMIAIALSNGTNRFDYVQRRLDTGEIFPAEIMLTAINVDGKPILQAVVRDMTERARIERELKVANDNLAARNDEQDRFMGMLSHELKTPMSVIRMALGGKGLPESIKTRVSRAVKDMNAVIERCLQSDMLRHDAVQSNLTECRLEDILENILTACDAPERLSLQVQGKPPCRSDAQLLEVILGNLVDNALKYGAPETTIRVVAQTMQSENRPGLCITVANVPGSAGMPDPSRVFSKYYRATGAHGKTGSGLGLHIAEGFARKIGGWLRFSPTVDEVRFELWVPQ